MAQANDALRLVQRRSDYAVTLDYFPTPPWAARALLKYVVPDLPRGLALEPACGGGHIADVLDQEGFMVYRSDIQDVGGNNHETVDFLAHDFTGSWDYVITNPPFRLADKFVRKALTIAKHGVGMLVRTQWLEGAGRYNSVFSVTPPAVVAVFSKRMPSELGKVVQFGSPVMSHAWIWWTQLQPATTRLMWLPPDAQEILQRPEDYK